MPEDNIKILSDRLVYAGKLFDLHVDEIELPGGIKATREYITHPGAVCMVPVDPDGRLLLVRQYRHAAGESLLELPAGTREPGEEPEETARRELAEEVGRAPAVVEPLGEFYVAPGYVSEYIHLYLCTGLTEAEEDGDEDEDIEVVAMTGEEALAAIESGDIRDAKSIIGILRWARRGAG
ncbi:MAG: NUDIX hydrolase [Dehalococcoidia bacterium]|nr:NUDIX hydrolase [Dehalococcoidia bacterium]